MTGTLLASLALALLALAPLALVWHRRAAVRGRRDAALALHRQQLQELDRDLADGRLLPAEHAGAVLEVQRRLLAADAAEDGAAQAGRAPAFLVLALIPLAAFGLYFIGGSPGMPGAPLDGRMAASQARAAEEAVLVAQLRSRLAALDPRSDQARQGYVLLGQVEESRGEHAAAAAAWTQALTTRFDPLLAARTAEAATRAVGRVTPEAAALFRRALAAAPADAPWRAAVEARLTQAPP